MIVNAGIGKKKQSKGQKVLFLIVDQGGRFDAVTLELKLESREMPSGEAAGAEALKWEWTLLEQNREWGRTVEQEAGSV